MKRRKEKAIQTLVQIMTAIYNVCHTTNANSVYFVGVGLSTFVRIRMNMNMNEKVFDGIQYKMRVHGLSFMVVLFSSSSENEFLGYICCTCPTPF